MKFVDVKESLTKNEGNRYEGLISLDYGDNIIRILPGQSVKIIKHYKTDPRMVCPRTDDMPCKLCDMRSKLYKRFGGRDRMPDNIKQFYDSLKASVQYFYPVLKFTDTELKVGYLGLSTKNNKALKEYIQSIDISEFDVKGIKLNFKKDKPASEGAFPTIMILPTRDTAKEIEINDWKEHLPNLEEIFVVPSDDIITDWLTGTIEELGIDL
jgi:hypothetical protein